MELLDTRALAVLGFNGGGTDNLDGRLASSVARSQFRVHLFDGTGEGHVTVLFVHIVSAGTRIVTEPHAVVLDGVGVLFVDLPPQKKLKS